MKITIIIESTPRYDLPPLLPLERPRRREPAWAPPTEEEEAEALKAFERSRRNFMEAVRNRQVCDACKGSGLLYIDCLIHSLGMRPCGICDGTGKHPTHHPIPSKTLTET